MTCLTAYSLAPHHGFINHISSFARHLRFRRNLVASIMKIPEQILLVLDNARRER